MKFNGLALYFLASFFSLSFFVQANGAFVGIGKGGAPLIPQGSDERFYDVPLIDPLIDKMGDYLYDKVSSKSEQLKEFGRTKTLHILNQIIPNFSQQIRTTKKTLETSLQYITTIIDTLAIPEKMSLSEAALQIKYLENEIKKLEDKKSTLAKIKLSSMTLEEIREGVKSGKISPAALTPQQIKDAYGITEEVN